MITVPTGERQVFGHGLASMLHGDDMIGFVWKDCVILVEQAIFAALAGALPHDQPQIRR